MELSQKALEILSIFGEFYFGVLSPQVEGQHLFLRLLGKQVHKRQIMVQLGIGHSRTNILSKGNVSQFQRKLYICDKFVARCSWAINLSSSTQQVLFPKHSSGQVDSVNESPRISI